MKTERSKRLVTANVVAAVCAVCAVWMMGPFARAASASAVSTNSLSHPPMRPLPEASSRPLGDGPHKYVAPDGSDQARGTEAEPWLTLGHAVRQLVPGDTLVLRGGVYYELLELGLVAGADRPITIRSYPNELATVDGGFREFFEAPESAWEPVTDGAEGEFRSVRMYPNLGKAQGLFGDSLVPLHSYIWLSDLRSNETVFRGRTEPLYCGPGLWYNPRSRRIHVRLAHDRADYYPLEHRYRGITDPRQVPMVVTGGGRLTARILGSSHLVIQDLVIRGAGRSAVEIVGSESIQLDGITAYSGYHALVLENTSAVRVINSRFRGPSAPWSSRISLKYKGTAGVLLRTTGVLTKNRTLELAWNEFTDGHDGVFLGEVRNADFHHNLVENFNDDGIFLTSRSRGGGPVRVFRNRISRCLSSIAFGWGRGQRNVPGAGVYIYRNLIEHLDRVYFEDPRGGPGLSAAYGNLVRDHGSPIWEPMKVYQNTLVALRAEGWMWTYLLGLGTHLHETTRDVFNNIVVHIEDAPSLNVPTVEVDFRSDGNLFWSAAPDEDTESDFFAQYRASPAFESSRVVYPPGWESKSVYGDPAFVRFDPAANDNDYRLGAGSAAVDAGVELPAEWPDTLESVDSGKPDIGALPVGSEPFRVGPRP